MKKLFFLLLFFSMISCAQEEANVKEQVFNLEAMRPLIQERGKIWGEALRTQNTQLLENLYDENAHYLPNDENALHGKAAIIAYWTASLDFLNDLKLNMETLEGTEKLLYETGNGTVEVMGEDGNFFPMPFKYVNVWKRQTDGNYKVVIDTFNDVKSSE